MDSPTKVEAEDGLEEGELRVPETTSIPVDVQGVQANFQGTLNPASSNGRPGLDSTGLNNEDSKTGQQLEQNSERIDRRFSAFAQLIGKDFSMTKGRNEQIARHMFRVLDHEQRNYRLSDSEEDVNLRPRTHRMLRKGVKFLEKRRNFRSQIRSAARAFNIHIKASPVTSVFPEDSLLDPFIVDLPRHPQTSPIEVSMDWTETDGPPMDPREKYAMELNSSMKRKRLRVVEMAENKLFRKLEEQDLKRRRLDHQKTSKTEKPQFLGVDNCAFFELLTDPDPAQSVHLDLYRSLTPLGTESEVKVELQVERPTKKDCSEGALAIMSALGVESPSEVDTELIEEILSKIGNVEDSSDLRKVEEMEKRLSLLLMSSRVYTNPHAVDFIFQIISCLKGVTSKKVEAKLSLKKGSIVALEVQPGDHHRSKVVEEIKKEVIRSLLREDFLDKEVAEVYGEIKRDPRTVEDLLEVDGTRQRASQRPSTRNNL